MNSRLTSILLDINIKQPMVNFFLVIYVVTMVEACSALIESNSQGTQQTSGAMHPTNEICTRVTLILVYLHGFNKA
jgi:hypothetical protein